MADRQIYIATAPSRTAVRWKNKQILWSALVAKCSMSVRTGETLAEYKAMTKAEQSKRKDVGGFVGGYLRDGRRKKGQVDYRDILTLDIDYAEDDTWTRFCDIMGCESFVYSTHTHTDEHPRYRLVILLDRSVNGEEYEAISRAVAARVGMELFDDTTYEPERLMYWPSSPTDTPFLYDHNKGEALCADEVLATYHNWHDASEWPCSQRVAAVMHTSAMKQGDPREKKGVVGTFCRCYNIHDAIATFLPDVYEQCGDSERYTYLAGTVAAGLVLYEDGLFAYSHNATDPCSQHLVNAFDLVRLHKFGHEDDDTPEETRITSRPSYRSMCEFAAEDVKVRQLMIEERRSSAENDFAEVALQEDNGTWMKELDYTRGGAVASTIKNTRLVLENDTHFKGKLWKNEFSGMDSYEGRLPWTTGNPSGLWSNSDDCCLRSWLEEEYGITGKDKITDGLTTVMNAHRRHPIKEYLRSLHWDGVARLDTMLIDFLGVEDTDLVRAQTRKQFTAAVARVMQPGCKYDYAMVISGHEGLGKSTLLARMGGKWFSDSVVTLEGKEGMESLRRAWIIELGELLGMKRSEVESVKQYLSRQTDKYRPAYGKREEEYPRQCVFFGTTNERNFLRGFDGNRRFWVIEAGVKRPSKDVFAELDDNYRDQLWAEAVHYYDEHEPLYLSITLERKAREKQRDFNELANDERIGIIQQYLDTLLPADWETRSMERRRAYFKNADPLDSQGVTQRTEVSAVEVLWECFGQPMDDKARYKTREIGELMSRVPGWEKGGRKRIAMYGSQRVWNRLGSGINNEDDL